MAIQYRNFLSNSTDKWVPIGVYATVAAYLTGRNIQTSDLAAGDTYYDTTLTQLRTYNGSTWSPAGATGTGAGSWDAVMAIGGKVTTDNAAEIELSAATSSLLTLDANGTTNVDIFDVSSAGGTGDLINLAQSGTGLDVNGTSGTWTVAATGNAVFNALWIKDSKELQFGAATGGDVSMTWDTSNLLIEAVADDTGQIRIGSTNAIDLSVYGSTNTNIALFDVSTAILEMNGWTMRLQDTDELQFGDASGGDVSIVWDTSNLLIEAETQDTGQIRIGSTNAIDLAVYGNTATDIALFDVSAALLDLNGWGIRLQDADSIAFGTGNDITINFDATDLLIDGAAADTIIKIGATNNQDLIVYGGTATNLITFDTDDSALECIFDNFDLRFKDDDYILLGDSATAGGTVDGSIRWDATGSTIEIVGATQFEDNVQMDGNLVLSGTLSMSGALAPGSISLGDTEALNLGDDTDYTISTAGSTAGLIITAVNANDQVIIGDGTVATDFVIDDITSAGNDIWFDQSADTAAGVWYFGKDGDGHDVYFYGNTASALGRWDASADQFVLEGGSSIDLQDNVELLLGTGSSNAGDFKIVSDGSSLLIGEIASAGKDVQIGVDGKGLDVKLFGETASSFCLWDQSGNQMLFDAATLAMGDGDAILLGDALGTGDFSISSTAAVLTIGQVASGTGTIAMGVDGKGIDQKWFAETTGDYMLWDQDGNSNLGALIFEDSAIQFAGANVTYTTAISTDALLIDATDHANASLVLGTTGTNGLNVTFTGQAAGDTAVFDAGAGTWTWTDINQVVTGADSSGVLLAITGIDTTGDTDTVTIDHSGAGNALYIDANEADSQCVTLEPFANSTVAALEVDGDTAGWLGADAIGMVHLKNDIAGAHANATMLLIDKAAAIAEVNDAEGSCLRVVEAMNVSGSTPAYAAYISSTNNEALHVDAGDVQIDEHMTATLGYQAGIAQTMTAHNDGGSGSTILAGARTVNVTAANAGVNDWILLPAAAIGQRLTIFCNVGANFELRTPAASNETINNVDADGGAAEYLCTDTDVIELVCHTATGWIAVSYTNLGAVRTAVIPDA